MVKFRHWRLRNEQTHSWAGAVGEGLVLTLDATYEWHNMTNFATKEVDMTLNVSLPAELESRVRAHVASGLYGSASEVIREALRLFEAHQAVQQSSIAALRADIAQGMADVNAGHFSKMDMAAIKSQGRELKKTS